MMLLKVKRQPSTALATEGDLFVDGVFECYTLEDPVRTGPKIPGKTAIPAGKYRVIVNRSNRFKRDMPLLLNVPGFDGIRIHNGNTAADTEGCILVGAVKTSPFDNYIGESKKAFDKLFARIKAAHDVGREIWLTVENA